MSGNVTALEGLHVPPTQQAAKRFRGPSQGSSTCRFSENPTVGDFADNPQENLHVENPYDPTVGDSEGHGVVPRADTRVPHAQLRGSLAQRRRLPRV